jgi:hypothetical protein
MDKSWVPLVVGFAALLLGWVIGFFDSNLRTAKKIREAEARAQFEIEKANKVAEEASKAGDEENLMRLWHDPAQKLNLDLDGQPVEPKALTTEQRRRLVDLMTLMRPWLQGPEESVRKPTPPPVKPEPERPIMNPTVAQVVASEKAIPKTQAPAQPGSIIQQIDAILQKKLAGTPLEKRSIRLQESLEGTLWIYVGLKRYEGIDAVPEEETKAVIRQAVAEWERTSQ